MGSAQRWVPGYAKLFYPNQLFINVVSLANEVFLKPQAYT